MADESDWAGRVERLWSGTLHEQVRALAEVTSARLNELSGAVAEIAASVAALRELLGAPLADAIRRALREASAGAAGAPGGSEAFDELRRAIAEVRSELGEMRGSLDDARTSAEDRAAALRERVTEPDRVTVDDYTSDVLMRVRDELRDAVAGLRDELLLAARGRADSVDAEGEAGDGGELRDVRLQLIELRKQLEETLVTMWGDLADELRSGLRRLGQGSSGAHAEDAGRAEGGRRKSRDSKGDAGRRGSGAG